MNYCVDGHQFPNEESDLLGDGKHPPFRVFNIAAQDYEPGTYPTRKAAQEVADRLNGAIDTVFIIRGAMGPEPHEGHNEGDLEWQFSDGPAGARGSSEDFASLIEGLEAFPNHAFNIDEADFTPHERRIFDYVTQA